MMNLRQKAEILAARPYTMVVARDETTTGEPIFIAATVELEGCLSQGRTQAEALENLKAAQIDFIHSLLEDALPVPAPRAQPTLTTSGSGLTRPSLLTVTYPENSWKDVRPQLPPQDVLRMTTPSLSA